MATSYPPEISVFLKGKSDHTLALFDHFIASFEKAGVISLEPTKTMIGLSNGKNRIAWVTQLGKNFIHVVFPFHQAYEDNLIFQKVAQVPGSKQFNHHFRMLYKDDVNKELIKFMKLAVNGDKEK